MRRNPIMSGFRRHPPIGNIPGSFLWILLTILSIVVAVPFGTLRITPRIAPRIAPSPKSGPLPAQVETRIATVGEDQNHRRLPFTVYVLAQQLSWKLESAEDLEGEQTMLSPELIVAINQAQDVFCVGTASFEGDTRAEEARAAQRAGKLAQWVATVIGNPRRTRLFTLNAGQYKGPKELVSSFQRKAIILVTGPHDEKVDLSQGLRSGLEQTQRTSPVVYSLLHHYSRSNEWLKLSKDPALNVGRGKIGRGNPGGLRPGMS
jgi:hypothetical protein